MKVSLKYLSKIPLKSIILIGGIILVIVLSLLYKPVHQENFEIASVIDSIQEGSSKFYNWGVKKSEEIINPLKNDLKPISEPVVHTHDHQCKQSNKKKCQREMANCPIEWHPDIDQYILKSSIPPPSDPDNCIPKNKIPPYPDMSLYVRKDQIPAHPKCPECPYCPTEASHKLENPLSQMNLPSIGASMFSD